MPVGEKWKLLSDYLILVSWAHFAYMFLLIVVLADRSFKPWRILWDGFVSRSSGVLLFSFAKNTAAKEEIEGKPFIISIK